jgi:hypothetical protein
VHEEAGRHGVPAGPAAREAQGVESRRCEEIIHGYILPFSMRNHFRPGPGQSLKKFRNIFDIDV